MTCPNSVRAKGGPQLNRYGKTTVVVPRDRPSHALLTIIHSESIWRARRRPKSARKSRLRGIGSRRSDVRCTLKAARHRTGILRLATRQILPRSTTELSLTAANGRCHSVHSRNTNLTVIRRQRTGFVTSMRVRGVPRRLLQQRCKFLD